MNMIPQPLGIELPKTSLHAIQINQSILLSKMRVWRQKPLYKAGIEIEAPRK